MLSAAADWEAAQKSIVVVQNRGTRIKPQTIRRSITSSTIYEMLRFCVSSRIKPAAITDDLLAGTTAKPLERVPMTS
jgi:hypothetical protein